MPLPEQQLSTWSHQGAQQGSAGTYASIRAALAAHAWPTGMDHEVYLQGSYANSTNIRGDSDVDVVVETQSVFYHNVPPHLHHQYGLTGGAPYTWAQFRAEVRRALVGYYGVGSISDGNKSLKVRGNPHRLNADVVPCNAYRQYQGDRYAQGMTFWTRAGVQVVNFPRHHRHNGARKNDDCGTRYKPNARVFKNARNRANNNFPSYFLECLIYNIPNRCFGPRFAPTFSNALDHLVAASNAGTLGSFRCQNEQQLLFGTELHQANMHAAQNLIRALVALWHS